MTYAELPYTILCILFILSVLDLERGPSADSFQPHAIAASGEQHEDSFPGSDTARARRLRDAPGAAGLHRSARHHPRHRAFGNLQPRPVLLPERDRRATGR